LKFKMNLFDLKGKTFLVTGASSGIGFEICKTITQMNGHYIAVARREEQLKRLIESYNTELSRYIVSDLTDDKSIQNLINSIDKIDGIVHCAGIVKMIPSKFYNTEILRETMNINYDSIVLLMGQLLKKKCINRGGSIVLMSSLGGVFGAKGNGIYAGSKGALIAIAKVWANELASQLIRVNTLSPGMVKTEILNQFQSHTSEDTLKIDELKYPLGYGNVEDVAYPSVFLLSDAAKWITGQNIIIDGGRSACI
jgi:NAD(P)-dependent dehydrogenase (short-subunit alcohol dehydrogenase family)